MKFGGNAAFCLFFRIGSFYKYDIIKYIISIPANLDSLHDSAHVVMTCSGLVRLNDW